MFEPLGLILFDIDDIPLTPVGPGCRRRALQGRDGLRLWVVEMDPGAEWPQVDHHGPGGEDVLILSGELIEGDRRLGPGTYMHFEAHSSHRPRTEIGARLYGINLITDGTEPMAP
jgi:anti-sigma factor ChrR (cupin superfamily)